MKKLLLLFIGVVSIFSYSFATTCPGATVIPTSPTFPYTQSLVCGATNDITGANATVCGSANYLGGQESVYSWTPSVNYVNATIAYNGVSWSGIFVYAGCPTSGGTCVGNITSSATTKTLNVAAFTAGVTYYFVFDTWPTPNSPCPGTFTLNASIAPPANPAVPAQFGGIPTCTTGAQLGFTNSSLSCSISAAASGNDDAATTATVTNFSCATGTITSATLNASIGAQCPIWYYYSIVVNGVTVATQQCNQSNFDLTPFLPLTSVSIISENNPADSPDFVNMSLTVNLNYDVPFSMPANVIYYWQTSPTGTSQAVPHVNPYFVFANGTYYVRAYNTVTGVWSTGSSSVVVSNFPVAPAPSAAVASVNPSCAPAGSTLTAAAAPAGYNYYWQGTVSGGSSTALPATTPYTYTASGTYYLAAYEPASQCWSNTVGTSVTVSSIIPPTPTITQAIYNVCAGATTAPIAASGNSSSSGSLLTTMAAGNGASGNMFSITATNSTTITAFAINANAGVGNYEIHYRPNNYLLTPGSNTSAIGWTLVGSATAITSAAGTYTPLPIPVNVTIPAGSTYSFHVVQLSGGPGVSYTNGTLLGAPFVNDANITFNQGHGGALFACTNSPRVFNGLISYEIGVTADVAWFDAIGGNLVGNGSPFETVGSTVLPNTNTAGSYDFFVSTNLNGCYSANSEVVTVNVVDVNVTLIPVQESCTNYSNGSFTLGTVLCGTAPFTYSTDGGVTFGAIPTNLPAGTNSVIAKDANNLLSGPISVVITTNSTIVPGSAIVPQAVYNICASQTSLPIAASVPIEIVSGTCAATATASGSDDSGVTATVNNFSCAAGTITGASLNATIGNVCPNWYYYSIVVNGVTVATQQCNQTNFDLTPFLPLTSVSIVSANNPADSPDFITMNLTVNITYSGPSNPQPSYTVSWYDAATGGNVLGTNSPLEAIGSSVMPIATNGTYEFYVGANLGGCQSVSNELVTVYVTNVNAVLSPVNVTCNGGNNGSFTLGAVECGTAPFTYSINGGAYGAIPTNLTAGTYSVVMMDNTGLMGSTISVVVTEPGAPTALTASNVLYFTADLSWTASGNETQWNVEYGPTGFTPGTGTSSVENATTLSLSGLTVETCYDVYVSAVCGTNSATTMINFCTNTGFFTFDNSCGPGFIDISGTGTNANTTDDSSTGVTLPWPWLVNGTTVNTITIGNNGGVAFNTLTAGIFYNALANGFSIFSQDLNTPIGGVYYQDMGVAPNRQFVMMWDALPHWPSTTGEASFEIIVDEASGEIYYVYDDVIMGNVAYDYGADAEIACNVAAGNTIVSLNNATYLTNNSCVHFYNALCPNPVNIVSQVFTDEVILTWSAGLYGETDWTVIYGPTGFDPLTGGTTITTSLPFADILGLTQLTTYDFYIYSECTLDNLTSGGLLVTVETLPLCSNPTGINTATAVDSLFTSWSWVETSAAYPSTGFNLQYGMTGFNLWTGTVVNADNNFTDTTANTAFLAGGVYQVYVQAVCGADTSNYMGPFTFVMPLTNDSVCGAEMLQVDGTVYTFNNTGATAQPGESALITGSNPAGYNPTDLPMMTWGVPIVEGSNWYSFIAPPTGNLRFSGEDEAFFASQIAIYELTSCSDFTTFSLVAASDQTDAAITTKVAPNFTICGLTPGNTYYVLHDAWSNGFGGAPIFGQYSIKMTPIVLQAGSVASMADVCTGDTTNLFTTITGYDSNGVWTAVLPSANTQVTDSLFVSSGLAYQIFDFEYRMTDGCAYDSIVSQVEIYDLSHAGNDGAFTVCKNEPVDLLSGLSGNVDLGGSWYDPSNNLMPSSAITASSIPGMFNYDYITGNGVCPDDTANVLVTVNPACDYLDIQEMFFGDMSLSPNPTNGLVYISNSGSSEVFNYEVTDVDGRVIATKLAAINGTTTTEVNLTGKVTGMYMIRVYNDNAMKVFRVILQ